LTGGRKAGQCYGCVLIHVGEGAQGQWKVRMSCLWSHVGQVERVVHVLLVKGVVHARRHVATVVPAASVVPQLAAESLRDHLQCRRQTDTWANVLVHAMNSDSCTR